MERRALVVRRVEAGRNRRRWWWWCGAVAAVVGCAAVVGVVETDPVAYGVDFWPIAGRDDVVEGRAMGVVEDAARSVADLNRVPDVVASDGVQVADAKVDAGQGAVWMVVRVPVPGGVRCRAVMVLGSGGVQVNSRRVEC
ncbi:hypothetical protein [Actinosynnema sp. NPDC020468]|uniref:hypothetical protein n=1 Tax=Actinosynnema sp. NPDC020468 TaxID=3154488 RepID=UPI0033F42C6E